MARRERKQPSRKLVESVQSDTPKSTGQADRQTHLAARRKRKFAKHGITIEPGIEFGYIVFRNERSVHTPGSSNGNESCRSMRSALKRAHQECRNLERHAA